MISEETRRVAAAAADEVVRRGWLRGAFGDDETASILTCKVCAQGAINAVVNGNPFDLTGTQAYSAEIADFIHPGWDLEPSPFAAGRRFGAPHAVIALWNDQEVSGPNEVIEQLRAVAASE